MSNWQFTWKTPFSFRVEPSFAWRFHKRCKTVQAGENQCQSVHLATVIPQPVGPQCIFVRVGRSGFFHSRISTAYHGDFILHIPRYPLFPRQLLILAAPVENQQIAWYVFINLVPVPKDLLDSVFFYLLRCVVIPNQFDLNNRLVP